MPSVRLRATLRVCPRALVFAHFSADAQIFDDCKQETRGFARFSADAQIFDFCKQGVKNLQFLIHNLLERRSASLALGADAQIFDFCKQGVKNLQFLIPNS